MDRVLLHVVAQFHERKKTFATLKPSYRFHYHLESWIYWHTWLGPCLLQKLLGCSICQLRDQMRIDFWDDTTLQFDLSAVIKSHSLRYSLVTIGNHWEKRLLCFKGWSKSFVVAGLTNPLKISSNGSNKKDFLQLVGPTIKMLLFFVYLWSGHFSWRKRKNIDWFCCFSRSFLRTWANAFLCMFQHNQNSVFRLLLAFWSCVTVLIYGLHPALSMWFRLGQLVP